MSISVKSAERAIEASFRWAISSDSFDSWASAMDEIQGMKFLAIHSNSSKKCQDTLQFIWEIAMERKYMTCNA